MRGLVLACARAGLALALAASRAALPAQAPLPGTTYLVCIAGVGGEPRITKGWYEAMMTLQTAATTRFRIPASQVLLLAEDSTRDVAHLTGRSTKATIERVLGGLASSLGARDRLVIVLFAHGSAPDGTARVNLPGPDMSAADFVRLLAPLTNTAVAVVHTGSASGDFVRSLTGPNRIVIAATKSTREQNETRFPAAFVKALTTATGDTNQDGRVSLFEAFAGAEHDVAEYFTQANLLPTEHPILEDGARGERARAFFLEPADGARGAESAELTALRQSRAAVQEQVDALRGRRAQMSEDAYLQALEPLLRSLAEQTRAINALSGKRAEGKQP